MKRELLAERWGECLEGSSHSRLREHGDCQLKCWRWDWTVVWALSPLLAIYLAVTLGNWHSQWTADEERYLRFADNLRQGGYALPGEDYLWNGPGYPLVLAAWSVTGLPPQWARFGNAGFLFLATVLFAHFMSLHVPRRWAVGTAWAMGLYVPFYVGLGQLMTEGLVVCLVCGVCLAAGIALRAGSRTATVCAGLLLGWLALTKVFFGYVLLGGLILYGLAAAIAWQRRQWRRMAAIYLLGLLTTTPYLGYTFHLTGKIFYWSNCGGLSLYCMSTPYSEEWGDWFHPLDVRERPEFARHRPFFASIAGRSPLEQDSALRRQAIANIKTHPAKFLQNVAANVARMWYSFPYSYTPQKLTTLFYVLPNSLLLSGLAIAGVVLWLRRPAGVGDCHLALVFMGLTLGGSALLSAYPRMLDPVVPGAYFLVGLAAHAAWNSKTNGRTKQ